MSLPLYFSQSHYLLKTSGLKVAKRVQIKALKQEFITNG